MKNILYRPSQDLIIHVTPSGDTLRYTPKDPDTLGWWLTNGRDEYDDSHLLMGIDDMAIGSVEILDENMELLYLQP